MLKTFEEFAKNVSFKPKFRSIDNFVFKLHYKVTFWSLLASTIIVSSQQYIGEHIRCISDKGVPTNVLETYCFFTTTFTVVRHLDPLHVDDIAHAGVGPLVGDEEVVHHAYYQWVPFVLFGQAIMFYLPHMIWRRLEGGRINALASILENTFLVSETKEVKVNDKLTVITEKDREKKISQVLKAFRERLHLNRSWAVYLVFCEILNGVNVIAQLFITDAFLGGAFMKLGTDLTQADPDHDINPLDVVFPKVTKCTFQKFGPSGTIQKHDALCVMALNVVNEKIYTFLWFWLIVLGIVTALALIWRLLTFLLHKRSTSFNNALFSSLVPAPIDKYDLPIIMDACFFSDWLFLYYLGSNIDGFVFKKLLEALADEVDESGWKQKLTSSTLSSIEDVEEKTNLVPDL
ncbi:innexin inx7 [Anabrus simplex]|uniref:innexin inx7 n=1 Tax=Anabrus simplex TaxID=316456 RepID=UPI0035A28BF7